MEDKIFRVYCAVRADTLHFSRRQAVTGVAGHPDARLDVQLPAHCCRPLQLHAGPDQAADAVLRVRTRQLAA
jgi:hypothetical protein